MEFPLVAFHHITFSKLYCIFVRKISFGVSEGRQEKCERNASDEQANNCVDQGNIAGLLDGNAAEQRAERGCRPGQHPDKGDDTAKKLVGSHNLRQTVRTDNEEDIDPTA